VLWFSVWQLATDGRSAKPSFPTRAKSLGLVQAGRQKCAGRCRKRTKPHRPVDSEKRQHGSSGETSRTQCSVLLKDVADVCKQFNSLNDHCSASPAIWYTSRRARNRSLTADCPPRFTQLDHDFMMSYYASKGAQWRRINLPHT